MTGGGRYQLPRLPLQQRCAAHRGPVQLDGLGAGDVGVCEKEEPDMTLDDIDRRLRAIEDIEEIKRLKARYCSYCDDNYNADSIANLFTEDAIWDGGIRGTAEGRDDRLSHLHNPTVW